MLVTGREAAHPCSLRQSSPNAHTTTVQGRKMTRRTRDVGVCTCECCIWVEACSRGGDNDNPCGCCCCGCGCCCDVPCPLRRYKELLAAAAATEADDDDDDDVVGCGCVEGRVVLVSECQNLTTTRPLRLQQSRPTA